MSSTTQAVRARGREWNATNITGTALLVLAGAWVLWNFIDSPTQTVQVAILGLCNGALYALIALGYTLVYGIIELINFAHGDLFMLGSIFAAVMIANVFNQNSSNPAGWAAFAVTFPLAMAFSSPTAGCERHRSWRR
jgi:branched-chain amino acid transport system permease protein